MPIDLDSVRPTSNDWFSVTVTYEGRGVAVFSDPPGTIHGAVQLRFDESGESEIVMDVDSVESERKLHFGLQGLLAKEEPTDEEKPAILRVGGQWNPCVELRVEMPEGTFSAMGNRILYVLRGYNSLNDKRGKVSFHPVRSQYVNSSASTAKYWVIPLQNFISEFVHRSPSLDKHPLRIYPTPALPEGLSEKDTFVLSSKANEKNKLIIFQFGGNLGFVEPLPDHETRKSKLTSGRERTLITSLMVGAVGTCGSDWDQLESWFPFDFLLLLSLASGTEVGFPWIELRDENGKLVQRLHVRLRKVRYAKGIQAIDERIHSGGTGLLLASAYLSPEYGQPHLITALSCVVKSGLDSLTLEERFDYLCRGFDSLCEALAVAQQNLGQSLGAETRHAVERTLRVAADGIRAIAGNATREGDLEQSRILQRISSRVQSSANRERAFGLGVCELLKLEKLNFPDADILDTYFTQNGNKPWSHWLSYYRGKAVHIGYFELADDESLDQFLQVLLHLHDLLLRVVLKLLKYDGHYQPSTSRATDSQPIDWVKRDTSPRRLGFGRPFEKGS